MASLSRCHGKGFDTLAARSQQVSGTPAPFVPRMTHVRSRVGRRRSRMRATTVLSACLTVALLACTSEDGPTQPEADENLPAAALSLAAASNTWTSKAPPPYDAEFFGYALGTAPNPAGQSIVYAFGGTFNERGGTPRTPVRAYNVATNTWTARLSEVNAFYSNGVGKIGSKLYFSGGYNEPGTLPSFTNRTWAYDYGNDRMIRKADLPIFGAEGVTGVINGKLYVLPGACSGDLYPNPGYCAVEETRRFYRYDPGTNTWATRRQAPHFHKRGAGAVIDGKFYVVGGFNGFQPVADLDVYDPATNTWRSLAPIPTGGSASGAALGGRFYVVVSGPVIRAYAYNPATNKWATKAAPDVFGSVVRVALDGRARLFTASGNRSALYTP
jgi:N-acetylneuraminic acid mutarotase